MPYTYKKLITPTTIRLIQVMPEKINDTIACIIHTYDTQHLQQDGQDISYRALSYRWGNPKCTKYIYLKDADESEWHRHPLHENLWMFINCVWQQLLFEYQFWTDYLCLNQCSDEEKASQIPRMGAIFAKATGVDIWLGLSEIVEDHFASLLNWPKNHDGKIVAPNDNDANRTRWIRYYVESIWRNDYWSRVWIVQEIVLAKKAVIVMRSLCMSPENFFRAVHTIALVDTMNYPHITILRDLVTARVDGRVEDWNMSHLLYKCISSPYQCTLPNDRLYGFLGLLDHSNKFIVINYDRPYHHVILDAVLEAAGDRSSNVDIVPMLDKFAYDDMPLELTKNANELEDYLHDGRTLSRHKELASLALQAFDAMSFIMTVRGAPQSRSAIRMAHSALSRHRTRCIQSETIFLGVSLVYGSAMNWARGLLEHWKACRYPRLQTQSWRSPWLCETHRMEDHMQDYVSRCDGIASMEEYMQEYVTAYTRIFHNEPSNKNYMGEHRRVFKRWHNESPSTEEYERIRNGWHSAIRHYGHGKISPKTSEAIFLLSLGTWGQYSGWGVGIEEACRHVDEHCDGSSMVFEIPHAYFRMTISRERMRLDSIDKETWT